MRAGTSADGGADAGASRRMIRSLDSAPYTFLEGAPAPLTVARAEGCYLYTGDGRKILDAAGGAIVGNVGYGRPEVVEAAATALLSTSYVVPPFATEDRLRLLERLRAHWLPPELERIVFTCGGSEALDLAIRLACRHHRAAGRPERWRVLGRDLSYHGTTIASLSIGGHTKRREGLGPWLHDQPTVAPHYCLRCPFGKAYPGCGVACAEDLERALETVGPETVAAFVVEPIVGSNAGALVPPDEYLPRIAEICRRHDILLIADEVMCGFGRTGRKFSVDHWGVVPDILVGGKGLTGGYAPLVAVCAREEVVAPIAETGGEVMFYTYSAHPASCAVADRVLEILEREALVERAANVGAQLRARLAELEGHPHVGEIRGRGLLYGIELVRDKATLEPFSSSDGLTRKVVAAGVEEGVAFYPGGNDPARDVIVLGPPFVLGDPEIELMVTALRRAIDSAVARLLD